MVRGNPEQRRDAADVPDHTVRRETGLNLSELVAMANLSFQHTTTQ